MQKKKQCQLCIEAIKIFDRVKHISRMNNIKIPMCFDSSLLFENKWTSKDTVMVDRYPEMFRPLQVEG